MIDFPANCTWCGHEPHTRSCARKIQTGGSKTPTEKPCPCKRQEATR